MDHAVALDHGASRAKRRETGDESKKTFVERDEPIFITF